MGERERENAVCAKGIHSFWLDHILTDKYLLSIPFGGYYLRNDICIEKILSKFYMFNNIAPYL